LALFIWLIIRLIQLVFSAGTVFFSQKNQPIVFFSRLIIPAERGQRRGQWSGWHASAIGVGVGRKTKLRRKTGGAQGLQVGIIATIG
jgi:hypothetical protein